MSDTEKQVSEDGSPVAQQNEPKKDNGGPETRTEVIVKLLPCPNCNDGTAQKTKDSYKWLKVRWALLPIVVSILALIVSAESRNAAQQSAAAAEKSAEAGQRNADTAKAALSEATRSNELSLRSWVIDVGLDAPCIVSIGTQKTHCSVFIRNFGKVPANNITFIGPNQQLVSQLPPKLVIGDPARLFAPEDQGTEVLAAGESRKVLFEVGPISKDQQKEITNKERFFLILGAVRYSDVFDKNWYTVWCYLYDVDVRILRACPGGSLVR